MKTATCLALHVVSFVLASAPAVSASIFTIWNGAPPGTEEWRHTEVTYTITLPPRDAVSTPESVPMVRNVVTPTLTAYFPDAATSTHAAVIICPGGGLRFLGWFESTRLAEWLAARGVAAFVLKYRLVPTAADPQQFEQESTRFFHKFSQAIAESKRPRSFEEMFPDAASRRVRKFAQADARQAVIFVRSRAAEWGISPDRIGMVGFSAGAFLVTDVIMADAPTTKLDFAVLISGGEADQRRIPDSAPPMFMAVAQDDRWMSGITRDLFSKWDRAGRSVELHYFEKGGHDFGAPPPGSPINPWAGLLGYWLESRHLVAQGPEHTNRLSAVDLHHDGVVYVPAYELPLSIYMSEAAKRSYDATIRESGGNHFWDSLLDRAEAVYPSSVEDKTIAGVRTEVVTPVAGIAAQNRDRVLINLHGGGFMGGAGLLQLLESIPISGTAKIKVISIDYRLSPDHKFPAASEDVAAVYKELLKEYKPQNIGIYGCSAGGILTAMSVAWFQKEGLPQPGAVGIFCAADALLRGDSSYLATALNPLGGSPPSPLPYLAAVDLRDPLVSPTLHPEILVQFPPTLLVTGTRDFAASSVIYAHSQLIKAGKDAELHVWEGMWHSFFIDVDIPESKEVYEVTAKFFDIHLGKVRDQLPANRK